MQNIAKVSPQSVVHPDTLARRTLMSFTDRLNFVLDLVKSKGLRLQALSDEQRVFLRRIASEVFGGVQEPRVQVRSTFGTLTTAAGGNLATVTSYNWGSVIDQSSWAAVWAEVKVLNGHFEVWPIINNVHAIAIFAVDYSSSTALGSYNAALAYDAHEVYNPGGSTAGSLRPRDHAILHVVPQGIPDKQWIATSDTTTTPAYLKVWSTNANMNTDLYKVFFVMDVKFRQVF